MEFTKRNREELIELLNSTKNLELDLITRVHKLEWKMKQAHKTSWLKLTNIVSLLV
jgi:hypothetical protein